MSIDVRLGKAFTTCALAFVLAGCARTKPFLDATGHVVPGSIATMETVKLGGIEQSVWFRGRSTRAPALILIHGGPGASESALFRHFDADLENHFLVVYWEQRGTGRSYHRDIPKSSMTIAQILSDLDGLIDTVRSRFAKDRVVLLGHSWGTILGTMYAHEHPEKVSAYVGVAQIADFSEDERVSFDWALREAERRHDREALKTLRPIAPAPRSVDQELALGRVVERLSGVRSTGSLIWAALRTSEATLWDLIRFGQGNRFSLTALRPEYSRVDLTRIRHFDVPVVFMLGRRDWHVPSVLAARYFDRIEAPSKRLIWFERSAHNPPFEQPNAFVRAVVQDVLPLAISHAAASVAPARRPPASAPVRSGAPAA